MKPHSTFQKSLPSLMAILTLLLPLASISQIEGSGNVTKQDRSVPPFTAIQVGSAFTVVLSQGDFKVTVETDDNLGDKIETLVEDETLFINSQGIKNPSSLKVYVTAPNITEIDLSGAARLNSEGVLAFPELKLEGNGASRANIELDTENLISEVTGASRVTLRGRANKHVSEVSGAASVNALMLETITTETEVSGAAKITVFATDMLRTEISGAGSVSYFDNPDVKRIKQSGSSEINLDNPEGSMPKESNEVIEDNVGFKVFEDGDSVLVEVGKIRVHVHGNDETSVELGHHNLEIDDEGNVKFKKNKESKFDAHWGGIDLGINGFLNADQSFTLPEGYEFLDLKMEKSINIAINAYEQNFNLIGDNFGITTGLGLEWNNYRFDDNVILDDLNDDLGGGFDDENEVDYIKSKLVTTYLTLPMMLELQSNNFSKINSFHLGLGVLSGLRIGTHTKVVHENGKKEIDKNHGASSMNPFKFDLMARLGWGKINLYGKYALNTLFKKDKGIEIYPFSVGISLVNW